MKFQLLKLIKIPLRQLLFLFDELPFLRRYKFGAFLYYIKPESALNKLFSRYGSDKGSLSEKNHCNQWIAHTYADIYELLFAHCRHNKRL